MNAESRIALPVLGAATILGLFGELLFHGAAWGMNILVWVVAFGVGAYALSRSLGRPIPKVALLAAPAILLFAALFGFREAVELKFANGVALFLLIGALLVQTRSGSLLQASITDLTLKAVEAWFKLTADFATMLVRDVKWTANEQSKERLQAILRGAMIATPLLVLFGCLFASADDAFRGIVSNVFTFNWFNGPWLFQTVLIFAFCAAMAAGVYRVILDEQKRVPPFIGPPKPAAFEIKLGMTEIGVIFGLLNALFGLFVIVQAQYFFGGAHYVRAVQGLSFTEYARHGFFELTAVAAGALATILGFHAMMREPDQNRGSFTILASILSAFVAVTLVSAFQRMGLYIDFFGLTELRVYTTAFMIWIAATFVWLAATVLRGHPKMFASGALVAGLASIVGLNAINPDAAIAQFNLGLGPKKTDVAYLESLSVDAAPVFARGSGLLTQDQAKELREGVRKRWSADVDTDWRGINYARWEFLNQYRREL